MSQGELPFQADPDFDARGKAPKSKKKVVAGTTPAGTWGNCAAGAHRLCAVEVRENGTLQTKRCACTCHKGNTPR